MIYFLFPVLFKLVVFSFSKKQPTSMSKVADMFHRPSVLIETPAFHSYFDIYIYKLTDLLTDFISCLLAP